MCFAIDNGLNMSRISLKKKKLILSLCILSSWAGLNGQNGGDIVRYAEVLQEHYRFRVALPSDIMTYDTAATSNTFSFGTASAGEAPGPLFEGGPVLHLADGCHIVLMDVIRREKPQKELPSAYRLNHVPVIDGWMLDNCALPWENRYLTRNMPRGVIPDPPVWNHPKDKEQYDLSEQLYENMLREVSARRDSNEYVIRNTALNSKMNCSRIYIARLPHFEQVCCQDEVRNRLLKNDTNSCYGVELYNGIGSVPVNMLVFLDDRQGRDIADYLELFGQFAKFE